jgi:hypothetical protein
VWFKPSGLRTLSSIMLWKVFPLMLSRAYPKIWNAVLAYAAVVNGANWGGTRSRPSKNSGRKGQLQLL